MLNEENAKVGYQAAVTLWTYEGGLLWSKFNTLLVANSVVLAALALNVTASKPLAFLTVALSLAGIALCLLWAQATKRSFDSYKYWIFSARELEESFLKDRVKTVSRGGDFADGMEVKLTVGGAEKKLTMSGFGRWLRVESASYLIITVFFLLYVVILIRGC